MQSHWRSTTSHKSEALRFSATKDHEEKERMSPPAALQLLFQKKVADIKAVNPKELQWSRYAQEQAHGGWPGRRYRSAAWLRWPHTAIK
jgi:hypothetical protein